MERKGVRYLGVAQPRGTPTDALYERIVAFTASGDGITGLRKALRDACNENVLLILSEEMFTVSTEYANWRDKLTRLEDAVHEQPYKILVTVREPVAAMFSLYCELLPSFLGRHRTFGSWALEAPEFEIYRYSALLEHLEKTFQPGSLVFQSFEGIQRGEISRLAQLCGSEEALSDIKLENRNSRDERGLHVRTRHRRSAEDILRRAISRPPARAENFVGSWAVDRTLRGAARIRLGRYRVRLPPPEVLEAMRHSLAGEMRALERFGVDYGAAV